jgi:hypothetical protein
MLSPVVSPSTDNPAVAAPLPAKPGARRTARLWLAALLLLLVAAVSTPSPAVKRMERGQGDVALFEAVVGRLRRGEPYYPAMGAELRQRGYPTANVFNWRTPFPLAAVAASPRTTTVCFFALGVFAVVGTLALLINAAPEVMLLAVMAQIGVTVSLLKVPQFVLMAEAWSGFLIMASILAYGRRHVMAGAALGGLALLARELAAPYCVVCSVIALSQKRWRETTIWGIAALASGAYVMLHAFQVGDQLGPGELAHKQSWVQFGGLPFLLRVISFSGWYDVLPVWSRGLGCVLLAASIWARAAPVQLRAMVAAYLVFFAIVGLPFNQYWGLVTAPAFALATGYGISGLQRLIRAAR